MKPLEQEWCDEVEAAFRDLATGPTPPPDAGFRFVAGLMRLGLSHYSDIYDLDADDDNCSKELAIQAMAYQLIEAMKQRVNGGATTEFDRFFPKRSSFPGLSEWSHDQRVFAVWAARTLAKLDPARFPDPWKLASRALAKSGDTTASPKSLKNRYSTKSSFDQRGASESKGRLTILDDGGLRGAKAQMLCELFDGVARKDEELSRDWVAGVCLEVLAHIEAGRTPPEDLLLMARPPLTKSQTKPLGWE